MVERLSAAHKPSDFSFLPCSIKAAHSPNPVWAIRSVEAGQPGKPELHLILELTGGRVSAVSAGFIWLRGAELCICQPERLNVFMLECAVCSYGEEELLLLEVL